VALIEPPPEAERSRAVAGTVDKAKGRVKEAAGALAGDDELKREGKIDQAAGAVKDAVSKVVDKVKKATAGKR
jgi:uncharacterized protein YjbJ (UPF0337 family)